MNKVDTLYNMEEIIVLTLLKNNIVVQSSSVFIVIFPTNITSILFTIYDLDFSRFGSNYPL